MVDYVIWDHAVVGSNPATQTIYKIKLQKIHNKGEITLKLIKKYEFEYLQKIGVCKTKTKKGQPMNYYISSKQRKGKRKRYYVEDRLYDKYIHGKEITQASK